VQTSSVIFLFLSYRRVHRDRRRSGKRHERADDRTVSDAGSIELHRISRQRAAEGVDQLPTKLTIFFSYMCFYITVIVRLYIILQSRKAPTFLSLYIIIKSIYGAKKLTFFNHLYII